MTRVKLKHEYITNDVKRKVSFRKRKGSIMKKMSELSILCGVEAGAIVYSGPSDPQPEVWPNPGGIQQVIERYQAKPDQEKSLTQEGLIQQRINKAKEDLKKWSKENREEEKNLLMLGCIGGQTMQNMPAEDFIEMNRSIDQSLRDINRKTEALDREMGVYIPSPPTSDGLLVNGENEKLVDQILQFGMDSDNLNKQQWWTDMVNFEDYMGFGADEMLLPFNYHNASSSNNH